MKRFIFYCLMALNLMMYACSNKTSTPVLAPHEGFVQVKGGKIWYRVWGTGEGVPMVMIHGGPGFTSYYLTPLADSLSKERTVIVFDQLGCGRSDQLTDTSLMNMQAHVDQVSALLKGLKIETFDLYGHSFGTMLATDFYLQHPENIRSIVLASPCLRVANWISDADTLMMQLPANVAAVLRNFRKGDKQDTLELANALTLYYNSFYNRKQPLSPYVDSSLRLQSLQVYRHMWGPEEFVANGNLKDYNRMSDLSTIKVPVLFTTGQYDAARPSTVKSYQQLVKGAVFEEIPDAGHSTMTDHIEADLKVLRAFWKKL